MKSEFICPNCKKKNRFKYNETIAINKIEDIYNKNIIKHKCKNCGTEIMVDQPLSIDKEDYCIYYINGVTEYNKKDKVTKTTRICDTYDDFKEKVLIFENSLNDLVIELIKSMIIYKLEEDVRKELRDVRYDSTNDKGLVFYLVGVNKCVQFPLSVYEELKKNSKIKKISTCIHVDSTNYNNYIKLK